MDRRNRTIYLEPLNAFTNQAFADFPFDDSLITEVRTFSQGDPIRVWEVNKQQFEYAVASRDTINLSFRMYERFEGQEFVSLFSLPARVVQKIRASRVSKKKRRKAIH